MEKVKTMIKQSGLVIAVLLMCLSVVLAGCSKSQTADSNIQALTPDTEDPQTLPSEPAPEPAKDQSAEIAVADIKPVAQQSQEKMAQLINDGTYAETISYKYHSGVESMKISVTLEGDVFTQASVEGINPHKTSLKFQEKFNAALPDLVIGKRIDQIDIPKQVSGSSLTTAAFKDYVSSLIAK